MQLPPPFHEVPVTTGPVRPSPDLVQLDATMWVADDRLVVDIGAVAMQVDGTERVVVDVRDAEAARAGSLVEILGYGAVMRALHTHAGRFCLHASLVSWGHTALAIAGHSTAGKSTTVGHLARAHRAAVLVDDVVPLELVDAAVVAHPYPRPVHLLPDAVVRLGLDIDGGPPNVGSGAVAKYALDLGVPNAPVAVTGIVVLTRVDEPADLALRATEVVGAERLRLVVRTANSSGFSSFGRRAPRFVEWSLAVASALPVLEIQRDPAVDTLDEVGRAITEWAEALAQRPSPGADGVTGGGRGASVTG